jgi:hypothetical protein
LCGLLQLRFSRRMRARAAMAIAFPFRAQGRQVAVLANERVDEQHAQTIDNPQIQNALAAGPGVLRGSKTPTGSGPRIGLGGL